MKKKSKIDEFLSDKWQDRTIKYGIAIGTVLATKGTIVPNAVGVDIGCGMSLKKLRSL